LKFIVGIGNPGKKYESTRHNAGFQVIDVLKKKALLNSKEAVLVRPKTFVNRTGDVILELSGKHKVSPQNIFVVCDDVNLRFGKLRLRASGSAGGHHGLESVIEALGSVDFPRLRIGVKTDSMPEDLVSFVLGSFDAEEKKELPQILEKAAWVCEAWTKEGFNAAMRRLSRLQSVK